MSANILDNLANWSTTDASNQPDGSDTADIDAEFRRLQSVIRKYTRTKGADIASAATCDLSTATGDYVDITGTTGITAFGTVSAGMRFILQFDDAVTITHHATSLILPGGVNITTAAGDVAFMESLGSGNWRCISYMRASGAPIAFADASVTYAKIQDISATARILGRKTAGSGDTEECTLTDILDMVGSSAEGDILYRSAAAWARLAKGTSYYSLRQNSTATAPEWAPASHSTISDLQAISTGALITVAHGLAPAPKIILPWAYCQTDDIGWAAGDTVMIANKTTNDAANGMAIWAGNTNIYARCASAYPLAPGNKFTGAWANPTLTRWRIFFTYIP